MQANTSSYFVFHIGKADGPSPKPGPEWPPVEPAPVPPTTDPVPTVPPVTGLQFSNHYRLLN